MGDKDKLSGRAEYEWPECRQDVTYRGDAVERPYKLPKKIFHLYKSSSLHVKQTHRKPLAYYGFIGSVCLLLVFIYLGYKRIMYHFEQNDTGATPAQPAAWGGAGGASSDVHEVKLKSVNNQHSSNSDFPNFKPASYVPESAPAYIGFNIVSSVPHLIGCINTPETGCKCYSKQAAPYPATQAFCQSYLRGEYFNPYKQPKPEQQQQSQPITVASARSKD